MADTTPDPLPAAPEPGGFPFVTVALSFATFFVFVGLLALAYNSPNYLTETKPEPRADPAVKLEELRAKNQAILDGSPGSGAKMSVGAATAELLGKLKTEKDRLPFPVAEPVLPAPKPAEKPKG